MASPLPRAVLLATLTVAAWAAQPDYWSVIGERLDASNPMGSGEFAGFYPANLTTPNMSWSGEDYTITFFYKTSGVLLFGAPTKSQQLYSPEVHACFEAFGSAIHTSLYVDECSSECPSPATLPTCNHDSALMESRSGLHVAIVVQGGNLTYYHNGHLNPSCVFTNFPRRIDLNKCVGAPVKMSRPGGGFVRDFRVYNRALSAQEIEPLAIDCTGHGAEVVDSSGFSDSGGLRCLDWNRQRSGCLRGGPCPPCSAEAVRECPFACTDAFLCPAPTALHSPQYTTSVHPNVSGRLCLTQQGPSLSDVLNRCRTSPDYDGTGRRLGHIPTPTCPWQSAPVPANKDVRLLATPGCTFDAAGMNAAYRTGVWTNYVWLKSPGALPVIFAYRRLSHSAENKYCFEWQENVAWTYPDGETEKDIRVLPSGQEWQMWAMVANGTHTTYFKDGSYSTIPYNITCEALEGIHFGTPNPAALETSDWHFLPWALSIEQLQAIFYEDGVRFDYHACPAGQFRNPSNLCEKCPRNYISTTAGSTACDACPAGMQQVMAGQTSCTDCPLGLFSPEPGASCTRCGAGTSSNLTRAVWCDACLPGTVALGFGSRFCTTCPVGTAQGLAQQETCQTCTAGYAAATSGASSCTICPVDTYQQQNGSASCTACPPGKVAPFPGSTTASACLPPCSAGQYHQRASTACGDCPPGRISLPGSADCNLCDIGFYQTAAGGSCQLCPPGSESLQASAVSTINDCICSAGGEPLPVRNETHRCKPCPAGMVKSAPSDKQCTDRCIANALSDPGATRPDQCYCAPSFYFVTASGACSPCPRSGMDCPGGWRNVSGVHAPPQSQSGFFMTGADFTIPCKIQVGDGGSVCLPGAVFGSEACVAGHEGLICGACREGYARTDSEETCSPCSDYPSTGELVTMINAQLLLRSAWAFFLGFQAIRKAQSTQLDPVLLRVFMQYASVSSVLPTLDFSGLKFAGYTGVAGSDGGFRSSLWSVWSGVFAITGSTPGLASEQAALSCMAQRDVGGNGHLTSIAFWCYYPVLLMTWLTVVIFIAIKAGYPIVLRIVQPKVDAVAAALQAEGCKGETAKAVLQKLPLPTILARAGMLKKEGRVWRSSRDLITTFGTPAASQIAAHRVYAKSTPPASPQDGALESPRDGAPEQAEDTLARSLALAGTRELAVTLDKGELPNVPLPELAERVSRASTFSGAKNAHKVDYPVFGLARSTSVSAIVLGCIPIYLVAVYSVWVDVTKRLLAGLHAEAFEIQDAGGVVKTVVRWIGDTNMDAFQGEHLSIAVAAATGLCLWSLGPQILVFILIKLSGDGVHCSAMLQRTTAYFTKGLREQVRYWEVVKRIDVLLVFLVAYTPLFTEARSKLTMYSWISMAALVAHSLYMPFDNLLRDGLANRLEARCLYTRATTLLCFLLLMTLDMDPMLNSVVAVVMVIANILLAVVFLLRVLDEIIGRKVAVLTRKFFPGAARTLSGYFAGVNNGQPYLLWRGIGRPMELVQPNGEKQERRSAGSYFAYFLWRLVGNAQPENVVAVLFKVKSYLMVEVRPCAADGDIDDFILLMAVATKRLAEAEQGEMRRLTVFEMLAEIRAFCEELESNDIEQGIEVSSRDLSSALLRLRSYGADDSRLLIVNSARLQPSTATTASSAPPRGGSIFSQSRASEKTLGVSIHEPHRAHV